jgi:hypothetical protein
MKQGTTQAQVPTATPSAVTSSPVSNTTPVDVPTTTPLSGSPLPPYISGHGTLVVNDTMLNQNAGGYKWQVSNDPSGSCSFAADGYHIKATNYYYGCLEGRDDLSNFVIEAQMRPLQGSQGGFNFRVPNGVGGKGYLVELGPTGYYGILKAPDNVVLSQNNADPLIPQNQTSYLVDIEVSGNQITLFVNKMKINSVIDNTYSHGYLGLYVTGNGDIAKTEVVFRNVKVWTLQ